MANFADRLMHLLALGLLLLSYFCKGHYQIKCSNTTEDTTSMVTSEDGLKGRYNVEWCTSITKNDTEWNLEIIYNRKNVRHCAPRNVHSVKTVKINSSDVNCSFVCLSTDIDLIFSACYILQSVIKSHGSMRTISRHNIPNGYSMDTFTNTVFTANEINHGDYISVNFYLGTVPATDYELFLCKLNDTSDDKDCPDITRNCSTLVSPNGVTCKLRGLAPARYELTLTHRAPWVNGDLMRNKVTTRRIFDVSAVRVADVEGGAGAGAGTALAGAAAALLALCAAAALLLLALHARRHRLLRKHVLRHWLHREDSKQEASLVPGEGPVLLVYAREGEAFQPVVRALTDLLETAAPGQVLDLYSAEATASSAGAGAAALRRTLSAPHRLVLLQSPALALHQRAEGGEGMSVYRCPEAGDFLLPLLLRTITERRDATPYRKHYLATLSGLETEVLPLTVPYRRYVLPAHAPSLLRDLAGHCAAPGEGDDLARAATDFVDHVRAHPHYLRDLLLPLPL